MSKKEILVTVVVLLILGGIAAGTYAAVNHYNQWKISKDGIEAISGTPANDNITLGTAPTASTDNSGLKVDSSANTNNPAQLGSGISTNTTSTSISQAPTAAEFAQYNTYKDAKNALFGEAQAGTGAEVKINSKVAIYYKGWLTDGTLFDQSATDSNGKLQAFIFTVGEHKVITGLEQDIIGMKVGGTRRMIIPPTVGYGAQQQGSIPPNSVLVFDVQLVAVQ